MSQQQDKSQEIEKTDIVSGLRVSKRVGTKGQKRIIQANPIRLGKDELNLIEHPFAALWQKEADDAVIFYQWDARHPVSGKTLPASWMVAGHRDHGLPTASDERVYLVLLELTREAGFTSPTVNFSRYDILQRLGWNTDSRSYAMLQSAFDRLQGVTINAKNAFWNPKSGSFRNTAFNIIDLYDIEAEPPGRKKANQRELPLSYFKWSDVMFDSFQSGYIRTLNLEFALALRSDIALRLYRYLDKKAYDGRSTFEIELFKLCEGHLGMRTSPYPSKLKERLKPAHDELIARGFLQAVAYEPMKSKKAVKVSYRFTKRGIKAANLPESTPEAVLRVGQGSIPLLLTEPVSSQTELALPESTTPESTTPESTTPESTTPESIPPVETAAPATEGKWTPEQRSLLNQMTALKVSPDVARDLLEVFPAEVLCRQLDCLEDREPRDKAATFVKAVRESWESPPKFLARQEAASRAQREKQDEEAEAARRAAQQAKERAERDAQESEAAGLDTMWEKLDARTRERIEAQAKERLGVLGQTGRAHQALTAMRRNLMREMLGKPSE